MSLDLDTRIDWEAAGEAELADTVALRRAIHAEPSMRAVPLTTEEEGVAVLTGAWLGGQRAVMLMQSSGVGNCINMFSLVAQCRTPFVALVTMRGEWGEFNPWQGPMSAATRTVIEAMGAGRKAARGMKAFLGLREPGGEPAPLSRFGIPAGERNFVRVSCA